MFGVTEFPPWRSKSTRMDSPWLDTGSYSVRMKHNASRRLSRYLPDPPDTTKIRKKKKQKCQKSQKCKKSFKKPNMFL